MGTDIRLSELDSRSTSTGHSGQHPRRARAPVGQLDCRGSLGSRAGLAVVPSCCVIFGLHQVDGAGRSLPAPTHPLTARRRARWRRNRGAVAAPSHNPAAGDLPRGRHDTRRPARTTPFHCANICSTLRRGAATGRLVTRSEDPQLDRCSGARAPIRATGSDRCADRLGGRRRGAMRDDRARLGRARRVRARDGSTVPLLRYVAGRRGRPPTLVVRCSPFSASPPITLARCSSGSAALSPAPQHPGERGDYLGGDNSRSVGSDRAGPARDT
jgi:hypothetical protein